MNLSNKYLKLLIFSIIFIIIDQAVKWWMVQYHPYLIFANSGVIFGFVENPWLKYLLIIIGLILLIWLISKTKLPATSYQLPAALIIAGALSNILDRLIYGHVIDYIKLPGFLSFWPTFNLADVFIVIGVIMYLHQLLKTE